MGPCSPLCGIPSSFKTSFISKHVGGDQLLLLWERNVVSFLSDQQDQALNSPEMFLFVERSRQPSSQTLLLQSHAFEWSAD